VRTGLYGGSFDPIHRGHLAAAEEVLHRRALDRLILVPAARPPHKPEGCVASFEDRVAMARLAAAPVHGLEVWDGEGRRSGPSYFVDTIRAWRAEHPDDELEMLVGADMLADLPRWKDAPAIVKNCLVVGFARPGADPADALAAFERALGPGRAVLLEIPLVPASSTEIRRLCAAGRSVGELVPPEVAAYMAERGLYSGLTPGSAKG